MNLSSMLMSYKVADVMDACDRVGIFDKLATNAFTVDEIGAALDLQPDFLDVLLRFGQRIGLFNRDAQHAYSLSKPAQQHLPLIRLELWARRWHGENDSLFKVLKSGQRCDPMTGHVADMRNIYDGALSEAASLIALNISRMQGIDGASTVDLGGADGALGEALLNLKVSAKVTVCDRSTAREGFRRRLQARGNLVDVMAFQDVDMQYSTTLSEALNGATLVLMSNVIHLLNQLERCAVFKAIRDLAARHVSVVIYDQFLPSHGVEQDPLSAPHLMVIDWLKCGIPFDFSAAQMAEEISGLGFGTTLKVAIGLPGSFILAKRPS